MFCLSSKKDGVIIYCEGADCWRSRRSRRGAIDKEFCAGNVDFEMPIRRSSGDIYQVDGFTSMEFREEVRAADINLKVISIDMV